MHKNTTHSGVKRYRNSTQDNSTEPFRQWHRRWSRSLYAMDVDFVEYTFEGGEPTIAGFFEYKHVQAREIQPDNPQLQILAQIANGRPAFFVRYTATPRAFLVYPLNAAAEQHIHYQGELFTEYTYVKFLHEIRDEPTNDDLHSLDLQTDLPPRHVWPKDDPPFHQ